MPFDGGHRVSDCHIFLIFKAHCILEGMRTLSTSPVVHSDSYPFFFVNISVHFLFSVFCVDPYSLCFAYHVTSASDTLLFDTFCFFRYYVLCWILDPV